MRIVCVSDTHLRVNHTYDMPEGDVLVHAGDATMGGWPKEIIKFNKWLELHSHKYKHILFTPGNHDRHFERNFHFATSFLTNAITLCDSEVVIDGVKFYGSPWQPEFFNWAFNLPRGEELARKWSHIPDDTNVLITHGPPHRILDDIVEGENVGCEDLRSRVDSLTNLKLHVFGHIHHSYGEQAQNGVKFVNAAACTEQYHAVNPPIVVDL